MLVPRKFRAMGAAGEMKDYGDILAKTIYDCNPTNALQHEAFGDSAGDMLVIRTRSLNAKRLLLQARGRATKGARSYGSQGPGLGFDPAAPPARGGGAAW